MEIWDGYKVDGTLAGIDLIRGEEIPPGLFHGVAEVFVKHEDGDILLMQRDFGKTSYPGFFVSGAGGAIMKGESYLKGAIRELYEETGLSPESIEELYCCVSGNTIFKGYLCITSAAKESVALQEGETISYKWLTPREFLKEFESEYFVPSLRERLKSFITDSIN